MINGKELMLGDYVDIVNCDYPEAVGVVEEIHVEGEEMYISIDGQVYDVLSDKDISAVLLSESFFLRNGFERLHVFETLHINDTYSSLCNGDIKVVVKIYNEGSFRCKVNGLEIKYVHEFQHLMRLLGLSEYANNLEV